MKKRYFGLRIRFTLLVSALLIVTFFVVAYFLVRNAQSTDIRNINGDSKTFASLATPQIGNTYEIYKDSGSIIVDQRIQSYTTLDSNISNVAIVDLTGTTKFKSNPNQSLLSIPNPNDFNTQYTYNSDGLISQVVVPFIDIDGQHPYAIAYRINTSVLATDNEHQIKDIIIFSVIGLILTALVMYELIYRFYVKPVELISKQAIFISKGNYDSSVNVTRKDEIGDLAQSVNTMSERLKADIQALKEVDRLKSEFITITSHNLRTPLSIIEGSFELLHSKELPKEISGPLHNIEQTSGQLASFAEDMLTISTIEAGESYVEKTTTTIEELVVPIRELFSPKANAKGIKLSWQIAAPETSIKVSVKYTRNILRGLVDNAIKFTDKGGSIVCQIGIENNALKIEVSDTGIGISGEEQAKLFTKFHRGTSILQYNYQGTGIGLYVTKLMTEAQQGTIRAASQQDKGSTFTVTIPQ